MNTKFLNLSNGSQANVFDKEDFIDLIEESLGYEAKEYLQELIEETEENAEEKSFEEHSKEVTELENNIYKLEKELEKVTQELEDNKKDISIDDILSISLCKIIKEVQKIEKLTKSKGVIEQQKIVIEMLNKIVKI